MEHEGDSDTVHSKQSLKVLLERLEIKGQEETI